MKFLIQLNANDLECVYFEGVTARSSLFVCLFGFFLCIEIQFYIKIHKMCKFARCQFCHVGMSVEFQNYIVIVMIIPFLIKLWIITFHYTEVFTARLFLCDKCLNGN